MPLLPDTEWQLEDYLRVFRLHRGLVLLSSVLLGGFVMIVMAQKPDIYQATARILIEAQPPQVVKFQEMTPFAGGWLQGFLQTEHRIITSRPVLEKIVEELNLAAFPPFSKAEDPAAVLEEMVDISPIRGTKLVDVSTTHTKAELAARIANAVADTYARLNLERRQEMTTGGAQWLREEVTKMEEKLRTSQQALQRFREEHGTVDFGEEQQNTILQRLRELTTAVTEAKKQRIEAETKYREKHPVLLELQTKERDLQEALSEQEEKAMELNRLSVQYNTLSRELKTNESIHNTLLTRLKELSVQEGIQSNNVQVVSYAQVPRYPIGPRRARATVTAAFLGFLLGCGLGMLRETLAKTLRTRREFEQLLEIPFLGYVPLIHLTKEHRGSESLVLLTDPKSTPAEAIRAVRTTLEFLLPPDKPQALLITSALPEEGKSLVSLNLAVVLQELDRKVLLVDGDMRRPSVHRLMQLSLEPGLSGYLQGEAQADELVQRATIARDLPIVPAGLTPPQPTDLLIGSKLRELLGIWKKEYQYILIDTPPVLAVADASALASAVDGVIYVLRAERTHREVALAGKQRLIDVGAKLIGGILNGARPELERGYKHYYYYYDKKGGRPRKSSQQASASPPGEPPSAQDAAPDSSSSPETV